MQPTRRRDRQPLLAYATEPNAPLFRAIVGVFVSAADHYQSRLRLSDVLEALPLVGGYTQPTDEDEVARRLEQLCTWGNLDHERDDALTNSLTEFEGRGFVYTITTGGEAAHQALEALEEGLARTGGLQTTVLRHILALLEKTVTQLGEDSPDGEGLYSTLNDLHSNFRTLTANATLFMQAVSRVLHAAGLDPERFQSFKDETVSYLTTFIDDLSVLSADIRLQLDRLQALPADRTCAALTAAGRASGTLAVEEPGRDVIGEFVVAADERLRGLTVWFVGGDGAAPGAAMLSDATREAVLGILRSAERLREHLARPSSQSEDLVRLARLFAAAPDDDAAAELWRAAFALAPARHLAYADDDGEAVAASISWWDAPPVEVPASLRRSGRADSVRRATRIPDSLAAKRAFAEQERRRTMAAETEIAAVLDLGERPLGELPALTPAAFELVMSLLDVALRTTPDADGCHRAVSRDGRRSVVLRPLDGVAFLRVIGHGQLAMPNYRLCVSSTAGPRRQRSSGAVTTASPLQADRRQEVAAP